MADVNANIGVNIDASSALAQLKGLQRQISDFHTSVAKSSQAAALAQKSLQTNLINSINSLGSFSAEFRTIRTTAESFTNSLEKNKFSMREYFRYAGASTKTFGKLFTSEFDTISKVAEDRVKRLQTQYIKMGRDASGAMKAIAVIPNELNMKDFATQTQLAAQKQAILNQLIKQGSTNLLNFGKNTQWAGRQLMVGFTLPLMTLGSTASRVFMDMETAAIKFKKVYGDLFTPQAETEQALENVKALATEFTKYGIAASKTVDLAAQAAAAGFQGIDLQRQTEQATRLAVLGQIEQQQALDTTISLQNAFKTSSAELASQINFLNAVENQTVTSLDDITIAIPKVAPVIQQLGGDVKDLAFFLTAMREGGINASEGANALKSGLGSLINPSKKASAMLMDMGININKIVESNKGDLRATVIEFAKALDTLDPLQRARAIEQLFGKFQFARLSTLFANVIKDGNQASRVLDLANSSASNLAMTAERELGITANSAMNKFKKAIEDIKIAVVPLGQLFLETVTPIINFATDLIRRFDSLPDGLQKTIAKVTLVVGAIGPVVLMTFGLFANAIANIIKLGNILRNGYLRLSGQSKVLGEQTNYLTLEQLDAAAVAHSLEQSHATLTQQFNVEAGAVEKLRSAYERANTAGRNFAAANPGMILPGRGRRPIRRNMGGKVSGPGTSTSDSIPAYLSDGEYVVNASAVKQYGPGFFDELNAQRFNKGGMAQFASIAQKFNGGTNKVKRQSLVSRGHIATGERGIMLAMDELLNQMLRMPDERGNLRGITSGITGKNAAKRLENLYGATGIHPTSILKGLIDQLESKGVLVGSTGIAKNKIDTLYKNVISLLQSPEYANRIFGGKSKNAISLEQVITEKILLNKEIPSPLSEIKFKPSATSRQQYSLQEALLGTTTERSTKGKSKSKKSRGLKFTSKEAKALSQISGIRSLIGTASGTSKSYWNRLLQASGSAPIAKGTSTKDFWKSIISNMSKSKKGFFGIRANKGLFRVPGTGNKDTVPAMLTPGESVIPKEQTKKYGSLVNGIIADNIPGFIKGKKASEYRSMKSIGAVPAPRGINMANPQGLIDFQSVAGDVSIASIALKDTMRSAGISATKVKEEFDQWALQNKELVNQASERVARGEDIDKAYYDVQEKYNKDMETIGGETKKLKDATKKRLPKLRKDLEQAQKTAKQMGLDLRTPGAAAKLQQALPQNVIAQQLATQGKYQYYNPARGAMTSMLGGSFAQYGVPSQMISPQFYEQMKPYQMSAEHVGTYVGTGQQTPKEKKPRRRRRTRGKQRRVAAPPQSQSSNAVFLGMPGMRPPDDGGDGGGTKSRFGKLGKLGRLGGGLGLFGAQMILDRVPNKVAGKDISGAKGIASGALTGAMIGSILPGWGTAIGAAAGGLIGLIGNINSLKDKAEQANASMQAGFTASETVAKLFGGSLGAAADEFTFMPGAVDEVTAKLVKATEQAETFKQILESIDKDDPLKKFIEGIKGLSGSELTGKVRGFVATQVASGALPTKEAEQFTFNILSAAGAAEQFDSVWKSIRSSVSVQTKAIDTQFKKLGKLYKDATTMTQEDTKILADREKEKNKILSKSYISTADASRLKIINDEIDALNKKYQKGKVAAENYGRGMLSFFNNLKKGNVNVKEMDASFIAIAKNLPNATDRMNAFRSAVLATGNEQAIKNLEVNKTLLDQIAASALSAKDQMYGMIAAQTLGAALQTQLDKVDSSSTKDRIARAAAIGRALIAAYKEDAEGTTGTTTGTTTTGGVETKQILSLLDAEINKLDKKADALKKVNDEMKRQNDFMMQQAELSKSMVQAKISGDYLGAALIGQQKSFGAAEFNAESQELNIRNQQDYLKGIQDKINNKQKLTAAEQLTLSQIKNKKNLTYPGSVAKYGMVSPVSGFTSSVASPSYSMSGNKGYSVGTMGGATNAGDTSYGGTVYNITMNVTGSNAEDISNKVIAKLNLIRSKNDGSNKVKI